MKTRRTVTEVVEAEGLRMQWTCGDGEAPEVVHLEVDDKSVAMPAELLERAAEVVRKARERARGPLVNLCLEHGYFEQTSVRYRCPTCEPEKPKEALALVTP
jgi:hypothetical protein